MMDLFKIGDIVARKSYNMDLLFKITDMKQGSSENICQLKGIDYRIQADAPESDLVLRNSGDIMASRSQLKDMIDKKTRMIHMQANQNRSKKGFFRDTASDNARKFVKPGKVLHLDGDDSYMATCQDEYNNMGIEAICRYTPEKEQPSVVYRLLLENRPDILVLTGHDGISRSVTDKRDLSKYKNSKYFIDAVKEARRYDSDVNGLAIFAGACQSCYPEIIKAGANFASAPGRILIHALDPVLVTQKLAYGPFDRVLSPNEVIANTTSGVNGIGGMQTRGKYRSGYPADLT